MNTALLPFHPGARLPATAKLLKRGERVLEPDVYVTPYEGRPVVVKDYRRYAGTPMALLARLLVWREARMLRHLAGWRHAPMLLGTAGGLLLGMEFVSGTVLGGDAMDAGKTVFRQLQAMIAQLHAAGITHNDLHTSNLMVSGGTLVLLDYASAMRLPRWMMRLPLLRELRRSDLANALKIQRRLTGREITGMRARVVAQRPWVSGVRNGWKRFYAWSKA
ncbi:kinase [Pseudoxanthomonas winnipegensis]|uniref:kinase n=1 Tax=Pseudoxanthomonas winnipegensis TaxID=2480810 RepID=UPI00103EB64C|nr:kinase [Pseudoxanthomonas winnipegensis]TBV75323.1 kinase [Pseudoxanthomonas winnipegensis]